MMPVSSSTFGQGKKNQDASGAVHSETLSAREAAIRRYSEIAVGIGLLLLIVSLLFWSAATCDVFFSRGQIHIPEALYPYVAVENEMLWTKSADRLMPFGRIYLSLFMMLLTFGAVVRRRRLLANIILGLSLLPWGFFSIYVPGIVEYGYALVVYLLVVSVKNGRNLHSAIYVIVFLLQSTITGMPGSWPQPSKYLSPETLETVMKNSEVFQTPNQQPRVEAAKNYVLAQVQLLNRNDPGLSEVLKSLPRNAFKIGSIEAERIAFMYDHLADTGIGAKDGQKTFGDKLYELRLTSIALGVLAVFTIIFGEGLEYLSNHVLRRAERVGTLSTKIKTSNDSVVFAPTTESRFRAAVRKIEFRFFAAAGIATALLSLAILSVLLAFWLAPASNGLAFTKVHIVFQVANDLSQYGVDVGSNYGMELPFYGSSSFLLTYFIVVGLIAYILPKSQKHLRWAVLLGSVLLLASAFVLFPVASVVALMFLGSRKYRLFGLVLFLVSVSAYTYGYYEMLHSGKIEKNIAEVQAPLLQNYQRVSTEAGNSKDSNQELISAYRYSLAQVAYLKNEFAMAAAHIHWIYQNGRLKSDLANQRLAIMRAWLVSKGDDTNSPGYDAFYVILFGVLAGIAHWALILGFTAIVMAILAAMLAVIFYKRWKSMDSLATAYSSHVLDAKLLQT